MALYQLEGQLVWPASDHNLVSKIRTSILSEKKIRTSANFIRSFLGSTLFFFGSTQQFRIFFIPAMVLLERIIEYIFCLIRHQTAWQVDNIDSRRKFQLIKHKILRNALTYHDMCSKTLGMHVKGPYQYGKVRHQASHQTKLSHIMLLLHPS